MESFHCYSCKTTFYNRQFDLSAPHTYLLTVKREDTINLKLNEDAICCAKCKFILGYALSEETYSINLNKVIRVITEQEYSF